MEELLLPADTQHSDKSWQNLYLEHMLER